MDRRILLGAILFILLIVAGIVNYRYFKGAPTVKREAYAPLFHKGSGATNPAPHEKGGYGDPLDTLALNQSGSGPVKFEPVPVDTTLLEGQLASSQWGREPFLTLEELRPPTPAAKEEVEAAVTVNSVLLSEAQGVTIINGRTCCMGELVTETGERVSGITKDGVLLEKAGLKRLIPLRQSKVQVTSRER